MLKERKRSRRRKQQIRRIVVLVLFLTVVGLLVWAACAFKKSRIPKVAIQVKNASILQGEEIPQFEIEAKCAKEKQEKNKLEKNYTIRQFLQNVEKGKGVQIVCEADVNAEGVYPVKLVLDQELEKKVEKTWKKKMNLTVTAGELEVKNKYGVWEKNKFKRHDGSYVTSDFVPSNGKRYYMNASGEKVTGWQDIDKFYYYFDKNGAMQTGWQTIDEKQYYFDSEGKMAIGWRTIDDATYYFDKKGKMLTGKQKLFQQDCEFAKDGKLISKKSRLDMNKPMVALTFDDGPGKYTDTLLDKLNEYGARATFFMVGKNAVKYPDVIKRMEEMGCDIGNHTTDHKDLVKQSDEEVLNQIRTTDEAIAAAIGHGATLLRPPYGSYNDHVKTLVDKPVIMWSLDSEDWKKKDANLIYDYVLQTVKDGDIILLHDIHDFSVDATLALIPELTQRGYQLVTVTELAEARGKTMDVGERYFNFRK